MSNAPERIWAQDAEPSECNFIGGGWWDDRCGNTQYPHIVEYVRADLVPQWQPIETAPKDGSIFLAAWPCGIVDTCKCFKINYGKGYYFHNADESSVCCSDVLTHPRGDPTHWMPMPTPPTVPKQEP